jgi:hypothetical protein
MSTILEAANLTGEKIRTVTGHAEASDAFKATHGDIVLINGQGPTNGNCETSWENGGNTISCHVAPNITNTIHEFGHAFDNYYHQTSNDSEHFAGNYFGGIELPRNGDGYKCSHSPCVEHSWLDF